MSDYDLPSFQSGSGASGLYQWHSDPSSERVAADGTVACGGRDLCRHLPGGGRAVLWALDLDEDRQPIRVHQVTSADDHRAITVCGQTRSVQARGWWTSHPGELPIAEHAVHCRREIATGGAPVSADEDECSCGAYDGQPHPAGEGGCYLVSADDVVLNDDDGAGGDR